MKFIISCFTSFHITSLTLDQKNIVRTLTKVVGVRPHRNLLTLENSEVAKTCEKLLKDEKTLFEF